MRHLNKTFEQYPKGSMTQQNLVSAFRNSIFLGVKTFMRVAVGNNVRAVLLPLQKNAGARIGGIGRNLNDYERTAMDVREQLQGLFGHRGYLRSQSHLMQAIYLAMQSFKHNTNFGNIGKGQFEGGKFAGKIITCLVDENPRTKKTGHGFNSMQILIEDKKLSGPAAIMQFEDYIAKGGRSRDLQWDLDKGHVSVE